MFNETVYNQGHYQKKPYPENGSATQENQIARHHPHYGKTLTDLFLEKVEPLKVSEYYEG